LRDVCHVIFSILRLINKPSARGLQGIIDNTAFVKKCTADVLVMEGILFIELSAREMADGCLFFRTSVC